MIRNFIANGTGHDYLLSKKSQNLPFARPLPLAQCVKAALLYLRIWNLLNNLRLEKPCSKISDQCYLLLEMHSHIKQCKFTSMKLPPMPYRANPWVMFWCQLKKMLMMACFPSIAVFLGVDGDAGAEDMES